MKSFNLATNKFFRKAIGFILLTVGNWYIIDKIDTNLEVLMYLFANAFGLYFVMEYSSYGNDEWVTIDFRDEQEKIDDEHNRKSKLLSAAKENLIMQVATGELRLHEAENRLEALQMLELKLNQEPLLLNAKEDFV